MRKETTPRHSGYHRGFNVCLVLLRVSGSHRHCAMSMSDDLVEACTPLMKGLTLTLMLTLHVYTQCALTALPGAPHSISLSGVTPRTAVVQWDSDRVQPRVTHFEMTLVALGSSNNSSLSSSSLSIVEGERRTITEIVGTVRSYSLEQLTPGTVYQLYIVPYNSEGQGNASSLVTFTTLPAEVPVESPRLRVHPAEVIIVTLIVIAWICAIVIFLHKWGKIRIVQPREPRYKHQPKNLDTIKVVKRPTDSVIYRNYNQQFSKTLQARETKRIARMNTMPNIKVSDVKPENGDKNVAKQKPIEKRNTMPIIAIPEEQETKKERLKNEGVKLDKLREEEMSPTESDTSCSRV